MRSTSGALLLRSGVALCLCVTLLVVTLTSALDSSVYAASLSQGEVWSEAEEQEALALVQEIDLLLEADNNVQQHQKLAHQQPVPVVPASLGAPARMMPLASATAVPRLAQEDDAFSDAVPAPSRFDDGGDGGSGEHEGSSGGGGGGGGDGGDGDEEGSGSSRRGGGGGRGKRSRRRRRRDDDDADAGDGDDGRKYKRSGDGSDRDSALKRVFEKGRRLYDRGRRAYDDIRDRGRRMYDQGRDLYDRGRRAYDDIRDRGRRMYDQGRDLYDRGRRAYDDIRDRGRRMYDDARGMYDRGRRLYDNIRSGDWRSAGRELMGGGGRGREHAREMARKLLRRGRPADALRKYGRKELSKYGGRGARRYGDRSKGSRKRKYGGDSGRSGGRRRRRRPSSSSSSGMGGKRGGKRNKQGKRVDAAGSRIRRPYKKFDSSKFSKKSGKFSGGKSGRGGDKSGKKSMSGGKKGRGGSKDKFKKMKADGTWESVLNRKAKKSKEKEDDKYAGRDDSSARYRDPEDAKTIAALESLVANDRRGLTA